MPGIELIIFDCDGTLMDSEGIAAETESTLLAEYGIEIAPDDYAKRFAGTSTKEALRLLTEEYDRHVPDDYEEKLDARLIQAFKTRVKTVEGAHEALDRLDQPRCICSNSSMAKLEAELRRGELWDRFRPYIYSAEDMEGIATKPAPDVFLHAAREFEVEPSACLVLEDSPAGVSGAKAAGCRVVGFTGGSHSKPGHADRLTEAGAETCIDKLFALPELVRVLGEWNPAEFA